MQKEVRILVHLCSKVTPEMSEYRPTPKQRSTMELLRYLTGMGPILVSSIKKGEFLVDAWNAAQSRAETLDFDAVVERLQALSAGYAEAIDGFSDEELQSPIQLFGHTANRGAMLVDLVVCGHAAYRTQLFCYLKSCGREELNTMNLWAGVDAA
jgi:hypothetical protein